MEKKTGSTVGIIGAGPAGITAAYELAKRGIKVELFEAQSTPGGMAKTLELWGQLVDLGPHRFFSKDPRVNSVWLEVVQDRYDIVNRLTRIYYNRTFFHYPLKAFNALMGLGIFEGVRCLLSYAHIRLSPYSDESRFDYWVINRFGKRLFGIFFKSYSEKLWGIPCEALDADFAKQRIKKLSLSEAIKAALFGNRGQKHKTLVDQFAYPLKGTGFVYEEMARQITARGGKILYDTPVDAVEPGARQCGIRLKNGEQRQFDHVVSTMPITLLLAKLDAPQKVKEAASKLTFRNTILVYLEVEGPNPFPDQWIYVHAPELQTGRIANFRNWVPSLYGTNPNTILCMEYWCYDNDAIWAAPEEELVALASDEIRRSGLIKRNTIKNGKVVRVPRCYPVYSHGYRQHLEPVERYLRGVENVSVIGRYGAFKYNNQDHSILMGILAAENIAEGTSHDLWSINSDDEYQETSVITKTGLAKK